MMPTPTSSTFHPGEQALQRLAGSQERLAAAGPRIMRRELDDELQDFWRQRPFVLLGARDASGQPWATLLGGPRGWIVPAEERLQLGTLPPPHDPLHGVLQRGTRVGLLGIEPHTRRRNRLNGVIDEVIDEAGDPQDGRRLGLHIEQSFGNCPRYIRPRHVKVAEQRHEVTALQQGAGLIAPAAALLARCDTFFIASAYPAATDDHDPAHGVDVSHRGGNPGFVRVRGDVVELPDYAGNNYFNTLGNLQLEPRAGLLCINWASGDVAWIAATLTGLLDAPAVLAHHPGATRVLQLQVSASRHAAAALQIDTRPG